MEILYEDNQVLVIYKEKGVLAQSDGSDKLDVLTLAKNYIKDKYNKPGNVYLGLVHRLDLNTEGLMVLARTSKAAKRLSLDISNHVNFNKKYLAIVEGIPKGNSIKSYLEKDEKNKKAYLSLNGKLALLDYKVLNSVTFNNNKLSIVDIDLKTGRFHQIRCQFASINHPLFGDKKYGSKNTYDYPVLQAYSLSFNHPVSKELLTFTKIDYNNLFKNIEGLL